MAKNMGRGGGQDTHLLLIFPFWCETISKIYNVKTNVLLQSCFLDNVFFCIYYAISTEVSGKASLS